MTVRLPSFKAVAIALASLFLVYAILAWLALPRILQYEAQSYVLQKSGHILTLDTPRFNPFTLELGFTKLSLTEPDGKPLLAFRNLKVQISLSSLIHRAIVVNAIRLDAPEATLVLQADGRLNWSALLDAFQGKSEKAAGPPPRIDIRSFVLTAGRVEFADLRSGFNTRIEPLELTLNDIATLPDDKGSYRISAQTTLGARVVWQGQATLEPLAIAGDLALEGLDLASLAPYLKDKLPIAPPEGMASLSTDYRLSYANGQFNVTLDKITGRIADLHVLAPREKARLAIKNVAASDGHFDLLENRFSLGTLNLEDSTLGVASEASAATKPLHLGALGLEGLQVDLGGHSVTLDRLEMKAGELSAVRNGHGQIDLLTAFEAQAPPAAPRRGAAATHSAPLAASAETPTDEPAPWHYRLEKFELQDCTASLRDESVTPAAELVLDHITLTVAGISDKLAAPLSMQASFRARGGGSFEAQGEIIPGAPAAEIKYTLADLDLAAARPYVSSFAKLTLTGGKLGSEGRFSYGKHGPDLKASFMVRDLRLIEVETKDVFLAWKSLGSRDLHLNSAQLGMGQLDIDGLNSKLIIAQDRSVNLTRILRKPEPDSGAVHAAPAPVAPPAAASDAKGTPFMVGIDRLRVVNSEMDYADYSLALPFGTRIHNMRGAINGLSSRPGAPAQLELDGDVDEYGQARAVGQIDLFDPTGFTDIKVEFRNVEMTRLTPYSATFAGRKIDSGKLSLDLEYKINKRQLAGDNKIVMDKLVLGERVESPQAKSLPLDLALAILSDSDGRIDLGLPVSGNLSDPEFSYGGIIWKALVNVVEKIATAPFRALGNMFGSGEKFESIVFEPGATELTPPEREKLVRLAGALKKRPGLSLTVHGVYSDADTAALQDRQVRRAVAERAGQHFEIDQDPGPLSTASPKVREALEALFAERFGAAELDALKEGFRKTNPGVLEESVSGVMISRLSGLLRDKRTLDEQELAQLKGKDFYALLFERLRQKEPVTDAQLQALAKSRADGFVAALGAAGAPGDHVLLAAPEKVDTSGRDVPVKLDLGAAAKPA